MSPAKATKTGHGVRGIYGNRLRSIQGRRGARQFEPFATGTTVGSHHRFPRLTPFGQRPGIGLAVSEVIEQCEFDDPRNEKIEGREAVSLRFRPRPGSIFSEESKFLPQFEGRIWIDAADRMICRLTAYPRGTEFEQKTSDHLLENAALAFDNTKTKEGVWVACYYRINGLKYHGSLLWHTEDLLVEYFDFKYFKTDSEKEKIIAPDKKG